MARRRGRKRRSKVDKGSLFLDLLEPFAIVLQFLIRIPAMLLRIFD